MNMKGFQILNGNDHKTFVYKYRNERVMIDTQEYMKNNRPPYNGSSLLAKKDYNSLKDLSDKDKIIIFPFIGVYNLGVFHFYMLLLSNLRPFHLICGWTNLSG